jgi:hypothetical protein
MTYGGLVSLMWLVMIDLRQRGGVEKRKCAGATEIGNSRLMHAWSGGA